MGLENFVASDLLDGSKGKDERISGLGVVRAPWEKNTRVTRRTQLRCLRNCRTSVKWTRFTTSIEKKLTISDVKHT